MSPTLVLEWRMPDPSRSELGDFLRSRRERLSPEAAGLASGQRRRTPGLRREEVAELAGIGIDWYVRLEQGRTVSPSRETLDSLARALRLDRAEREHLRTLARRVGPRTFVREVVPEPLRRMVERLGLPAYVTGRRWDVLVLNDAADEIFDIARLPEEDRNLLVYMLTSPGARSLFGPHWEADARRMVAQFRATYDFWAGSSAFLDLLARLRRDSPEFSLWWGAHDVRGASTGVKRLHHPVRGPVCLEYASFRANDDPTLNVTVYTPV